MTLMRKMGSMFASFGCRVKTALANNDAMATLEAVLLIAVLVALVLMFKDTIVDFVSNVLDNISSQSSVFDPASIAP